MIKKMRTIDTSSLSLLISICIVLYIRKISVNYGVLAYSLIWTWSIRSAGRLYEFYLLNFMMNVVVSWFFILLIINFSPLKNISAKYTKISFVLVVIPLLFYTLGLTLSDVYIYLTPSDSVNYVEAVYEEKIYCEYWVFGIDSDYLGGGLCDVEN